METDIMRIRYLYSILILFLIIGSALLSNKEVKPKEMTFENILSDAQSFYKNQVGNLPNTPIRDIGSEWYLNPGLKHVLAYCMLTPGDKYITFNHGLINQMVKETGNKDLVFQVILHEYTHCEGHIGHIQMYGHYMNDGGSPWLYENEVKDQFKSFLKFYRKHYRTLRTDQIKPEDDLDLYYALMIEKDANGNIRSKCTCSTCLGIEK